MYFTVGQKRHKVNDVTMETRASCLLYGKKDLKALLASNMKDIEIELHPKKHQ
jgi:hypothetical protein